MFDRFNPAFRHVISMSGTEAALLNHDYIGTGHMLLGIFRAEENLAATALGTIGLTLEDVRSTIEEIIGRGERAVSGHQPFTPRAKKVIELSLRESLRLGHDYIGPEHLLLAIVREGEGIAAQIITTGCLDRVRSTVLALLSGNPAAPLTRAVVVPGPVALVIPRAVAEAFVNGYRSFLDLDDNSVDTRLAFDAVHAALAWALEETT